MKLLSKEELAKWTISHDAFISTCKQGYIKFILQMGNEFNGLISAFETLYPEQPKGGQDEND